MIEIAEVADFPVRQILEQCVEVMKVILQELLSERMEEDIVAVGQIIPPDRWRVDHSRGSIVRRALEVLVAFNGPQKGHVS